MKYKGIAYVPGKPIPIVCYGEQRNAVADWASRFLALAPKGTKIEIWEERQELLQEYTKRANAPETTHPSQ